MTTRQLTEYREWPDGRKGCLFYIQGYQYSLFEHDVIVLVDSPVRIYDTPGHYDNLHKAELHGLVDNPDAFVAEGYAAHVLVWMTDHYGGMDDFDREKDWELYCTQQCRTEHVKDDYCGFLRDECLCLMRKNDAYILELLTSLLDPKNENADREEAAVEEIGNAVGCILYDPLKNWLSDLNTQFKDIHPRITFRDNSGAIYAAMYNPYRQIFSTLQEAEGQPHLEVLDFQAALMNFALADYIYTDFERQADKDRIMQGITDLTGRLWPYMPEDRTLDYEQIKSEMDFAHFDVQGVIDTYIGMILPELCSQSEKKVQLGIIDKNRQKRKALRQLFEQEWAFAQYNHFLPFMKRAHSERLKKAVDYFFSYLLELLEDSPEDYDACFRLLHPDTPDTVPEKTENTPETENVLPPKGKYVELVAWLRKEKELGRDYLAEAGGNRTKMCRNLKKIIGWEPKPNSLGKQWNL